MVAMVIVFEKKMDDLVRIGAINYKIAFKYLQQRNDGLSFAKQLVHNFSGQREQLYELWYAACETLWVELFNYVIKQFRMTDQLNLNSDCLERLCSLPRHLSTQLKYKQVQIAHMILYTDRIFYSDKDIYDCMTYDHFTLAKYIIEHGKRRIRKSKKCILSDIASRFYNHPQIIEFCFINGFHGSIRTDHVYYLRNKHVIPIIPVFEKSYYAHNIKLFNIGKHVLCKDVAIFTCRFVGFAQDFPDRESSDSYPHDYVIY